MTYSHTASVWKTIITVIIFFFLGGCTTTAPINIRWSEIDMHTLPPVDFPKLSIVVHQVSHTEMLERCQDALWKPLACAETNFKNMVCDIWYSDDVPPTKAIIDHEELHCKGYDHVGESSIRDAWEKYKQRTRQIS